MLYFFDSRVFRSQNRCSPSDQVRGHALQNRRFAEYARALTARVSAVSASCGREDAVGTGKCPPARTPMMATRSCKNGGFCLDRRVYSLQPRDFRALCNQRQHRIECRCRNPRQTTQIQIFMKSFEREWQKFQHRPLAGFERDLKATAIAADGEGAGSSGCGDGSRRRRFVVERS